MKMQKQCLQVDKWGSDRVLLLSLTVEKGSCHYHRLNSYDKSILIDNEFLYIKKNFMIVVKF